MCKFIKDKNYCILEKAYTKDQIEKMSEEDGYVEGVIKVSLSNLINTSFENFLDYISVCLIDSPCLMDIQYEVVGVHENDIILLLVSGQVYY